MISIANKKPRYAPNVIEHLDQATWKNNKKPMFRWLDQKYKELEFHERIFFIIEQIIKCTNSQGITIATNKTILANYNAAHPGATIKMWTFQKDLRKAQELKLIKKGEQLGFNMPCETRILLPKYKSVNSSVCFSHTKLCSEAKEDIGASLAAATPLLPPPATAKKTNLERMLQMIHG